MAAGALWAGTAWFGMAGLGARLGWVWQGSARRGSRLGLARWGEVRRGGARLGKAREAVSPIGDTASYWTPAGKAGTGGAFTFLARCRSARSR